MIVLYLFRSIAVWGGIERILVDKMNYLVEIYNMDVYLITTDQGAHQIPYVLSNGVHHENLNINFYQKYRFHGIKRIVTAKKMRKQYELLLSDRLRAIKPDLIVCTTADPIDSITKVKGSIPVIVESHSICIRTIENGKYWFLRKLNRRRFLKALYKIDMLVALTEGDAQEWRKYHHHVCVIPNFVHQHKENISNYESKKTILVGRFDYQKRVQYAIKIWKNVKERHPDWILDIYGEGEEEQEIRSMASAVGNIIVHKPSNNIFKAYRESSFLIMTSLFEPFGLVLPEAMSCGLPVIAFDCPYGPREIVTNGRNGYLINERDFEDFANKICSLMENSESLHKMGDAAINSAIQYTPECVMPQYIDLFEQLKSK